MLIFACLEKGLELQNQHEYVISKVGFQENMALSTTLLIQKLLNDKPTLNHIKRQCYKVNMYICKHFYSYQKQKLLLGYVYSDSNVPL